MKRILPTVSSIVTSETKHKGCRRNLRSLFKMNDYKTDINRGVDGVSRPPEAGTKCFVARANPVTGKTEWIMQAADYDYHQEIARSAYADMLHDTERNQKYYAAIIKAVQLLRARGCEVRVLDIGTGTGLLSMMAATAGADTVTACEAFQPMAECALSVIEANGFADKINLIPKRSTEITVGPEGCDMPCRANLLVTEVFDTELIGEGAINTYNHAHEHLLEEDCLVVPGAANMYVQPVTSSFIRRWNSPQPIAMSDDDYITFPIELMTCGGAPSLHDLQLDQVDEGLFSPLSPPIKVFRFDFSKRDALKTWDSLRSIVKPIRDGTVDAVFMWWELEMDPGKEITLSCAPSWAHPDCKSLPWRDHWMQAIFYTAQPLKVKTDEEFSILSHHDMYSLWFESAKLSQEMQVLERPVCTCGMHLTYSRSRLGMLSDPDRNDLYLRVLRKYIGNASVCLCISDGTLLPLMAAKLGADKVFTVESNAMCARLMHLIISENKLEDKVIVIEKQPADITQEDFQGMNIDIVIGEPSFQAHVLPWDNMYFWYAVNALQPLLSSATRILPESMSIHAIAMQFKDLWKIRAPVGLCEGFLLNIFDNMVKTSADIVDEEVEPQPLWEYPGVALSQPTQLLGLNFTKPLTSCPPVQRTVTLVCEEEGTVNGVALWCVFDFGHGLSISTGPRQPPKVGEKVIWDYYTRQAVHLFHQPHALEPGDTLDFDFKFTAEEGNICFCW